ncbi:Aspartate tyrosine aromatic aminotransferase [Pyrenophora tritici-repentis]|uniref:Acc synthase n=2 Tax=Pyrenophora tritici-repentis TaxID=45151 RepID=A0A2W1F413_9PLEO|nr:1-aminocyclopropane-1-carboxylate synthase 1 [Pyrenophora tritici-repentis Pt-1C-BFP]KAA8622858.1 Acc synthase [Pyrenophora tritici-repentis]EDU45581.1 1-aminocyclopropane-1-carboxylate synthase 1 [Pyrenophora tritici-repentis Pt-1C-BFP]KAF7451848.1 Acc synthase [Pyrenophora tritici-repentis]KAF7575026.1 Aspartate-tyrosine-aromatic aminotransferase [Pyrenophora tritici-repentis]KAG9386207.1 Acc synthase [Pyrenophora tritici-repentis]
MLSSRGRKYAALDLAASYKKDRGQLYDANHPRGLISFRNAENFLMHDEALDYIKTKCISSIEPESLTYHDGPFGSKRLRQAMASFINSRFAPVSALNKDQVTFVSGVTALNDVLSLCLTEGEEEGLLLGMPIYGSFAADLRSMSKCKLVYTPFRGVDQFGVRAVECYEWALQNAAKSGVKVKGLLLANPSNPLGQCYSREALEAILRFCNKYSIHLISDEIYALSVYDTDESRPGFTSVLSLDTTGLIDRSLIHVMYGMSKDFAAAGLRLGCLVTYNEELGNAVQSLARFHAASPVTDAIATVMLEDEEWHTQFLAKSARVLNEHQSIAAKGLDAAGIPYNRKSNAGFFLWIDLSACLKAREWDAEDELKLQLYNFGLEMSAGNAYHDEEPGKFRFIFSVDKDMLEEALRRVVEFYVTNRRS